MLSTDGTLIYASAAPHCGTVCAGSPSRGGDVAIYVSVLVSISVFVAPSTVFHSIKSPDNSLLSHSVLRALF